MCCSAGTCVQSNNIKEKNDILAQVLQEECFISNLFQIGNRFALTAAHCLYDEDFEEVMQSLIVVYFYFSSKVLPARSFSIVLGLHDRRKTKEPNRWLYCTLSSVTIFD